MLTIDLTIKNTALPISVQKKEEKDAEAVYQEVVAAMRSDVPKLIELTCDKQEGKKVAVKSDSIGAVIISQKDGAAAAGRVPGFFSALGAE
ncbi:MAG: hypothetical protein ACRC2R_06510 [Xenococcaceae cyanobacterium]